MQLKKPRGWRFAHSHPSAKSAEEWSTEFLCGPEDA